MTDIKENVIGGMEMMNDPISRQAAIDAVYDCFISSDMPCEWQDGIMTAINIIRNKVPSAQPKIIRCKDCKYKHIENMVWACPFGLPGGELFFCAYGAERGTDE